jgi:hypothetical protein
MNPERRLVSLRRRVEGDAQKRYRELWSALAEAVIATGAHAWGFVSTGDPQLHLEFLEFRAAADPRGEAPVRLLLERLDAEVSLAETEEWLEAR